MKTKTTVPRGVQLQPDDGVHAFLRAVLAEVYPLLHAAFGERLHGFDQVSAGCLPQNCGPCRLCENQNFTARPRSQRGHVVAEK